MSDTVIRIWRDDLENVDTFLVDGEPWYVYSGRGELLNTRRIVIVVKEKLPAQSEPNRFELDQTINDILSDHTRRAVVLCASSPTNERGVKLKENKDGSRKWWATNDLIGPCLFVARMADTEMNVMILVNTTSVLPAGISDSLWDEESKANAEVFRILCKTSLKLVIMTGCMFPEHNWWKSNIQIHSDEHKCSLDLPERNTKNTFVLLWKGLLVSGKYSALPLRKSRNEIGLGMYDTHVDKQENPDTYKISMAAITRL